MRLNLEASDVSGLFASVSPRIPRISDIQPAVHRVLGVFALFHSGAWCGQMLHTLGTSASAHRVARGGVGPEELANSAIHVHAKGQTLFRSGLTFKRS